MSTHTLSAFAKFNGLQETPNCAPWFGVPMPVWTLTVPLAGLCVGSTYAEETLRRAVRNHQIADEVEAAWVAEGARRDACPPVAALQASADAAVRDALAQCADSGELPVSPVLREAVLTHIAARHAARMACLRGGTFPEMREARIVRGGSAVIILHPPSTDTVRVSEPGDPNRFE
jgi:hypothetical protein